MAQFAVPRADRFVRGIAAVAMLGPMLLVVMAGLLPEGLERGQLVVWGNAGIVVALTLALLLRVAYAMGYTSAFQLALAPDRSTRAGAT
jgi:hypothetical protein